MIRPPHGKVFFTLFLIFFFVKDINSSEPSPSAVELEKKVQSLVEKMTLEQKVGQMIQAEIAHVTAADIKKYRLGSILNGGGSFPRGKKNAATSDWRDLADELYQASIAPVDDGVAIPLIWGTDAVHGHNNVRGATLFPHNIGLGAAHDPDLIERIGQAVSREVYATGIDWAFAPTIAVARDDRWGRTYESYSEDPTLVREYAARMVRGLQGAKERSEFFASGRVIATAKHFIGDGGTEGGRDQGDTIYERNALVAVHGQGYISAISAGVQTVMASFNSVNGVKVHGSKTLLTDVLKGQMGFDGLVVSDWNGIGQVPGCSNNSCATAINAGIDIVMAPEEWKSLHKNTVAQVLSGEIPMSRIDDAVRRILRVKLRYKIFDQPRPSLRGESDSNITARSLAHRELSREAVRKSLVLLKNERKLIPLSPKSRLLVLGDGADSLSKQSGGWSITWQGTGTTNDDFPGATSILSGIRKAVELAGGSVDTVWDRNGETRYDAAIVIFGEDPYAEGEGDRESLVYSESSPKDLELLTRLKAANIPVVSVFLSGRPMWVNPELNASTAFIAAWLPGTEGAGVADLVLRDIENKVQYEFTGRLSFSWPASPEYQPTNGEADDPVVLFSRGYGLRTTDPEREPMRLSEDRPDAELRKAGFKIFDRRPVTPWGLFAGDSANWRSPLAGGVGASSAGVIKVSLADKKVQGDARRIDWSGSGEGQIYFQSQSPHDFTAALTAKSALAIDLRVEMPPTSTVSLRMDCGYPCGAKGDITNILRSVPTMTWARLTVDLKCFSKSGLRPQLVDTPLLLSTSGKMVLTFASVSIVPEAGPKAAISCSKKQ